MLNEKNEYKNMKKKTYIVPAIQVQRIMIQQMICGSLTRVSGDTDVDKGEGDPEPPGGADTRRHNVWDDMDEEKEY